MGIVYERTGGVAGLRDVLRIDDSKRLELSRRGQAIVQRELSAEEASHLEALLGRARAAQVPPAPKAAGRRLSDTFTVSITLEGEPTPRLHRTGASAQEEGESPWLELLSWLDGKRAEESQRAR